MMRARSPSGLDSALGRPARSLHADDRHQRAQREGNPFDRELAPRRGRIAAHRRRAREPGDLHEPGRATSDRTPLGPRGAPMAWYYDRERLRELRERLGLKVRCFGTLEPPRGPSPPRPPAPALVTSVAPNTVRGRDSIKWSHDGSRTRAEARVAYPDGDEDAEEIATPTRRFSLLEITSGLPDDSREADERFAERDLRELRARVETARAVVEPPPGLAKMLQSDWRKTARFYARSGVPGMGCLNPIDHGHRRSLALRGAWIPLAGRGVSSMLSPPWGNPRSAHMNLSKPVLQGLSAGTGNAILNAHHVCPARVPGNPTGPRPSSRARSGASPFRPSQAASEPLLGRRGRAPDRIPA
jgi:hypothetical protein